jgi:hypothetical protein
MVILALACSLTLPAVAFGASKEEKQAEVRKSARSNLPLNGRSTTRMTT